MWDLVAPSSEAADWLQTAPVSNVNKIWWPRNLKDIDSFLLLHIIREELIHFADTTTHKVE